MSQLATRKSQPQPRRPRIVYNQMKLPQDVMALLRMTWYERPGGPPRHVEEFTVWEAPSSAYIVSTALQQAAAQGFDLQIASQYDPIVLGLRKC